MHSLVSRILRGSDNLDEYLSLAWLRHVYFLQSDRSVCVNNDCSLPARSHVQFSSRSRGISDLWLVAPVLVAIVMSQE